MARSKSISQRLFSPVLNMKQKIQGALSPVVARIGGIATWMKDGKQVCRVLIAFEDGRQIFAHEINMFFEAINSNVVRDAYGKSFQMGHVVKLPESTIQNVPEMPARSLTMDIDSNRSQLATQTSNPFPVGDYGQYKGDEQMKMTHYTHDDMGRRVSIER